MPAMPASAAATAPAGSNDKDTDEQTATLVLPDGREHKIKMYKGQLGDEQFLDIRDLGAKAGCFT